MQDEAWVQERIRLAAAGELEAFGELVQEFQGPVRGFIAMLGVPPDSVEDLAQETFLLAYREIGRFESGRAFGPWLRGIARNFARRFHAQKRRRDPSIADLLERRESDSVVGEYPERFRLEHLRECLKGLSERSATLVRETYVHGRRSGEIARSLGLDAVAVRMALVRVRLKLRDCVNRRIATENA